MSRVKARSRVHLECTKLFVSKDDARRYKEAWAPQSSRPGPRQSVFNLQWHMARQALRGVDGTLWWRLRWTFEWVATNHGDEAYACERWDEEAEQRAALERPVLRARHTKVGQDFLPRADGLVANTFSGT